MLLEKEFVACKRLDMNLKLKIFSDFRRKESKMLYFCPQSFMRGREKAGRERDGPCLRYLNRLWSELHD